MSVVLYVYLDQAHWIHLLQAEQGHRAGAKYVSALADVRRLAGKQAVFPLSSAHYIELNKIGNERKRSALGSLMFDISGGRAILPFSRLLPMEIDRALKKWFGKPYELREAPLFGFGGSFALGIAPPREYNPPAGVTLSQCLLNEVQEQHRYMVERAMWTLPSLPGQREALAGHFAHAASFVTAAENERSALRDAGAIKPLTRRERLALAVLTESPHLVEALNRAGVSTPEFAALGRRMVAFVEDMPSMLMTLEMREFVQSQAQRKWSPHDLVDIAALSIAIPYCDIVATENQWTHLARVRKLSSRFRTRVTADLIEVPRLVETLSSS